MRSFRAQILSVDPAARTTRWPCIADAGRRARKVDGGKATAASGAWRSCAAKRGQMVVGVVKSNYDSRVAAWARTKSTAWPTVTILAASSSVIFTP